MSVQDGLLDAVLEWTCARLEGVRPEHLDAPTPCAAWPLRALLDHMEDSLDAFAEATSGVLVPVPAERLDAHPVATIPVLRQKATALARAWRRPPPGVRTGSHHLPAGAVAEVACLEIAVHGWDVAAALAACAPGDAPPALPNALAVPLTRAARRWVSPDDRPERFDAPLPAPGADPSASAALLAFLGRSSTSRRAR